jgi:lipopolysaccharide export system protein LptA
VIALCAALAAGNGWSRSSDRNQPMDITSNTSNCSLNDSAPCILAGNVRIVQGTLDVRAARADIRQAGGDIQRVLLSGSPVLLTQQLDNGSILNARASNVDYDLPRDVVVFSGNVQIDQRGRGTMSGPRIVYNMRSGQVQGAAGESGDQIRTRILPRGAQGNASGDRGGN